MGDEAVEVDGTRGRDWQRWALAAVLAFSLAAFLWLRLRNLGHVLIWDEAQFVMYARSFVRGAADPQWSTWSRLVNLHPPLYLWICSLLYKGYGVEAIGFEAVSVLFSLGTLLLTWRLARFLYGRWVGALAMFFLAVMPAASIIDTWVKQDAAAIFFMVLSIYLFVRKRHLWSGMALGLGMLSKETAVFALPALGVFVLANRRRDMAWGLVKAGTLGAAISFWWYVWVSDYVGHFGGFFLGRNLESEMWREPWHYYFTGLPGDLGWAVLAAVAAGLAISIRRWAAGDRWYSLPVGWFLSVYAFLSFSAGKPYWMITPALPAAAVLAAVAAKEAASYAGRKMPSAGLVRAVQVALVGTIMAAALLGAALTDYADFNRGRKPAYWEQAEHSRQCAEFLRRELGEGDVVYAIFNSLDVWDPTLLYYLDGVDVIPAPSACLCDAPSVAAYLKSIGGRKWIYVGTDPAYDAELEAFLEDIGGLLEIRDLRRSDAYVVIEVEE